MVNTVLPALHSDPVQIYPEDVSAVIPTRGNVDLGPVLDSLPPFAEVIIWDNSTRPFDARVYGRYLGVLEAASPVVYVQDDDCTLDEESHETLLELYEPGLITANMPISRWPDYPDSCLVGWGSIFDAHLPALAFTEWQLAGHRCDDHRFYTDCDVIFTALTPHRKVDVGFTHLPWAEGPDRMFKQPGHKPSRDHTLDLARKTREA